MPYIHFTDEQKQRANSVDMAELARGTSRHKVIGVLGAEAKAHTILLQRFRHSTRYAHIFHILACVFWACARKRQTYQVLAGM